MDGLRALLEAKVDSVSSKMDERDRRYEDRFTAMDEKTGLALTASEKAVVKAELATEKRFDGVNEFRGTLSDQAATLMPRGEANAKFAALEEKVAGLKEEVGRSVGADVGSRRSKDESRANLAALISIVSILLAVGGVVVAVMSRTGH